MNIPTTLTGADPRMDGALQHAGSGCPYHAGGAMASYPVEPAPVNGRTTTTRNLSAPAFSPGQDLRVAELLQALPMVKGEPIENVGKTVLAPTATLRVRVQGQGAADPLLVQMFYDFAAAWPTTLTDQLSDIDADHTFVLGRIGIRIAAMKIDSAANPSETNPTVWQVRAAAAAILRALDTTLARGSGVAPKLDFKGLYALAADLSRKETSQGASIEYDARRCLSQVHPTGRGAGEGACCLIGGALAMRALMATSSGQQGASGVRRDPRTGLMIYHYQGVPFYRVDVDEATHPMLYAANLGPSGLCLVHAYGSAESYGLVLEEQPIETVTATRSILVHGAYALVAWEPEAIWAIEDTPVTNL